MELQWPLILFALFVAWSAGLFGSQCVVALRGGKQKAQMAAWITSAVLLVVGCVAVFTHLQHWERIFNGFGNLTSGITLELIGIVLLVVIAVIFFAFMRKGKVPAWVCITGLVIALGLVIVLGTSYLMASRPAWYTVIQVLSVVGYALALGPATMLILLEAFGDKDSEDTAADVKCMSLAAVIGTAVGAVTTVVYTIAMNGVGENFVTFKSYLDTTQPTKVITDPAALSVFGGDAAIFAILAIVAAVLAIVFAVIGKKAGKWVIWGTLTVICAVAAAILLRVVFFMMGVSVFSFY